jgi:hypothetical protein
MCAGCGDKTEAHLERFLDPGKQTDETKPESLDPFAIPDEAATADRINMMTFREVAKRLGAHRMTAQVRFALAASKNRASLREEDLIVLARNGDFRVKVENDGGQGYELVYSAGRLYACNRHEPFHEKPTLNMEHLQWRDAAYGGWASIYRLFRGRLGFTKRGMARHHGRDAVKFSIGLTRAEPRLGGTPKPPPIPEGIKKYILPIKPTASQRNAWRDHASPGNASGTLLVDADQGAILSVDFDGELFLPDPAGTGEIALKVSVDMNTDGFGNPPSIEPPDESKIQPTPERIQVDTHPIDFFFGKGFTSSRGAAAGVAQTKEKDDPRKKSKGGSESKP